MSLLADSSAQINNSIADYIEAMSMDNEQILRSIDLTLKSIARQDGLVISQTSLRDLVAEQEDAIKKGSRNKRDYRYADNNANGRNRGSQSNSRSSSDNTDYNDARFRKDTSARAKGMFDKLTDDFEDAFSEALFGSKKPFQDALSQSLTEFARSLGTDMDHLGETLGKQLAKKIGGITYKTDSATGQKITLGDQLKAERKWMQDKVTSVLNSGLNKVSNSFGSNGTNFDSGSASYEGPSQSNVNSRGASTATASNARYNPRPEDIIDVPYTEIRDDIIDVPGIDVGDIVEEGMSGMQLPALPGEVMEGFTKIGPEITELVPGFAKLAPAVAEAGPQLAGMLGPVSGLTAAFPQLHLAMLAVTVGIELLSDALGPAIEGFKSFAGSVANAATRQTTANAKYLELQKKRAEADAKTLKEAAFDVIKQSANKVEEVWDNVLTTVSATQGYDKAGVQDLWSSYAQRLSNEGLASVVSSADIMDKLTSVLGQGLSGAVAEEFAYQATLLNSAIPTEDFFQYAQTYASIAANAIKNGADQDKAIQVANEELQAFASNLLYASRSISGGFTTSLTSASSLFEQSAKIALTSRVGDISDISGVLTSVSGIVGAIAPDMASSIVDAVVSAATGGNSSELTALRSLAGTGASNTAFLQALARDPKKVFSTLFTNLAGLQNMSSANYMEVAEALSQTFGMPLDAFARVDFNYLANAITSMNLNNQSLEENMALLAAGQTTSTESQVRMQKINEYMIDQGLAYVLDNEVARAVQEHMWEEQLAREIEETMFAVDLQGGALDLLNGIITSVQKITNILNPAAWIRGLANIELTARQSAAQTADLRNIIKAGAVGLGNATSFSNLTTAGVNLNLASSYLSLLGQQSATDQVMRNIKINNAVTPLSWLSLVNQAGGGRLDGKSAVLAGMSNMSPVSYYTRNIVSKSAASSMNSGDWRTNVGFNAIWQNYEESGTDESGPKSQQDAQNLSKSITQSIQKYTEASSSNATSLDTLRATIEADEDRLVARDLELLSANGSLQHRSYMTQADLVAQVLNKKGELTESTGSFEEWLKVFQKETGISNLAAILSDYGEDISTIEALYNQQESANSSAQTKARELHEVQFWEDMQQFATVDFPWLMREWERYYIQHEAYTNATNSAYQEAVNLQVEEHGELGDSVLALAKALTENSMWQESLGDAIKDPVVQTNVLLSKILLTVEAIMQRNNEVSVVSVPTSLASLGLGVTNT